MFRVFRVKPLPAPQGISANSCPFVVQKLREDTCQYVVNILCCSVDCFPLTSSDSDFQFRVKDYLTRRRKGRRALCSFVLMSKNVAHRAQKYTELTLHTSAQVCVVCVRQITPRRDSVCSVDSVWDHYPLRKALVKISGSKDTCRYAPIRG